MLIALLVGFTGSQAFSRTFRADKELKEKTEKGLCFSTEQYIQTLKFMRTLDFVKVPEKASRHVADIVSKGCDGAFERFSQTFRLLKKMGVTYQKVLELAVEFSQVDQSVQENFFEILQQAYLKEVFDFNFHMALDVAFDFSKNLSSHHQQAREDFIQLARFCRDSKKLELPLKTCAQLAIELAHLSPYFYRGVFDHFKKFIEELRYGKDLNLPLKEAMPILVQVLRHGSRAPDNFLKGYRFALAPEGLEMNPKEALGFAMLMVQRSSQDFPPPVIETTKE